MYSHYFFENAQHSIIRIMVAYIIEVLMHDCWLSMAAFEGLQLSTFKLAYSKSLKTVISTCPIKSLHFYAKQIDKPNRLTAAIPMLLEWNLLDINMALPISNSAINLQAFQACSPHDMVLVLQGIHLALYSGIEFFAILKLDKYHQVKSIFLFRLAHSTCGPFALIMGWPFITLL